MRDHDRTVKAMLADQTTHRHTPSHSPGHTAAAHAGPATNALIPGPILPVRCACCRRWIRTGPVIQGRGITCARRAGLTPTPRPRIRAPGLPPPDNGLNLFDLLDDEGDPDESSERICSDEPHHSDRCHH